MLGKYCTFTRRLLCADENLSHNVYSNCQNNEVVKVLADIISLSCDEILWFGVPSLVGCLVFTVRSLAGYPMGCIEETAWDCFGSCAIGTCFESIFKWTFQRVRPRYSTQSEHYSISGEWFSFPSGHSLRAFYWMFWLSRSKFVKLIRHLVQFPRARHFIPWATLVGWSRVAKGRHFLLDVFCGAILGSLLGYIFEDLANNYQRAIAKTLCGIYTVANWGYLVVIPILAGNDHFWNRIIAGLLFYSFAVCLLFSTYTDAPALSGLQTVYFDEANGHSTCMLYW